MSPQPYTQLIDIKQWADRGLVEAARLNEPRQTPEETVLMRRILDHFHTVDRIFRHHLQGTPHGLKAASSEILPTLDDLANSIREVDDWYAAYVRSLAANDLERPVDFTFTSGRRARMRVGEILLHVSLHGTYHRGNAGALLQLKGLTPSRDAITDYLEDAA